MSFKKGQKVKQVITKPIEGTVIDHDVDKETGTVLVKVAYDDGHSRFFKESELEIGE